MNRRAFLRAAGMTGLAGGAISAFPSPASADASGPVIDPTDSAYGAVGDGVADDTDALRAALADAEDGVLQLPPGQYRITGSLTPKRCTIRAATELSSPMIPGDANGTVIRFGSPFTWSPNNAMIDCTGGDSVAIAGVVFERAPGEGPIEAPPGSYPYPTVLRHHGGLSLTGCAVRGVRSPDGQSPIWAALSSGGGGWFKASNTSFSDCDGGMRIESAGSQLFDRCYFGNNFGPNLQVDDTFNIQENAHVVVSSCIIDETFATSGAQPSPSARIGGHEVVFMGTLIMGGRGENGAPGLALHDAGARNRYIGCTIQPWHTNASVAIHTGADSDPLLLATHVASSDDALPLVRADAGSMTRFLGCTFGPGDPQPEGPGQVRVIDLDALDLSTPAPSMQESVYLGNQRASGTRSVFVARERVRIVGYRLVSTKGVGASNLNSWGVKLARRSSTGDLLGEFGARTTRPSGDGPIAQFAPWGSDTDQVLEGGESLFLVLTRTGSPDPLASAGLTLFWEPG